MTSELPQESKGGFTLIALVRFSIHVHLVVMNERGLKGKTLAAASKVALEWALLRMQTLDVVLQSIHACEVFVAHRTIHFGTVWIMYLQVSLETILPIKCLVARGTDKFPRNGSIASWILGLRVVD